MSKVDPNGPEASKAFLEANKGKDGVIVLPSGLQYKVLNAGTGMFHPKVGTPCECHYEGTLIDGTEFDSSYGRGEPTTFAPNQVIKGWTEAMQLMVEGDKWEMYIPMEMAYGASGKPPKIPAAAALIFRMEILKIKGDKEIKANPEWTPEQLALFDDAAEGKVKEWKDSRIKSYEDGNMRDTHPTREGFDAWLDKQCQKSRNKTIAVRVEKAAAAAKLPPKLTKEKARALLTKALETFKEPANKEKLTGIVKETEGQENAAMMKMMKLMPAVQGMMEAPLKEYGFGPNDLMSVTMQIQACGAEDPSIATDVAKLMKAVQGDFADILDA